MTKEIEKKVEKIKMIYAKYLKDLSALKRQQNLIITRFIKEIEERKIEEIRKVIGS